MRRYVFDEIASRIVRADVHLIDIVMRMQKKP